MVPTSKRSPAGPPGERTGATPMPAVASPPPATPRPRYRCCSDDASWRKDRGRTERLGHLPAAGQRGTDALAVLFCRRGLSLEKLDRSPASGSPRSREDGEANTLVRRCGVAGGRGARNPPEHSPARGELPGASLVTNPLESVNVQKIKSFASQEQVSTSRTSFLSLRPGFDPPSPGSGVQIQPSPLGRSPDSHPPRDSPLPRGSPAHSHRLLPGQAGHGVGDVRQGTLPERVRAFHGVGTHVLEDEPVPDVQLRQLQAVGDAILRAARGAPQAAAEQGLLRAGSLQGMRMSLCHGGLSHLHPPWRSSLVSPQVLATAFQGHRCSLWPWLSSGTEPESSCLALPGWAENMPDNVRDPWGSHQVGPDPHLVQLRCGAGPVKQEAAEGAVDAVTKVIHEALLAARLFLWRGARLRVVQAHGWAHPTRPPSHQPIVPPTIRGRLLHGSLLPGSDAGSEGEGRGDIVPPGRRDDLHPTAGWEIQVQGRVHRSSDLGGKKMFLLSQLSLCKASETLQPRSLPAGCRRQEPCTSSNWALVSSVPGNPPPMSRSCIR